MQNNRVEWVHHGTNKQDYKQWRNQLFLELYLAACGFGLVEVVAKDGAGNTKHNPRKNKHAPIEPQIYVILQKQCKYPKEYPQCSKEPRRFQPQDVLPR